MDEEFQFHLEMLIDEFMKGGMTRSGAEHEARRQFGRLESVKEAHRDQRGLRWVEDAMADLHYGARLMLRYPGFSAVAILTMALGIGANSAIFSIVNAVFLRQAPYPNGARLVDISRDIRGQIQGPYHNSRRYLYFRERARSFEDIAAIGRGGGTVNLIVNGEAEHIVSLAVSFNFFRTLGVNPFLGRSFDQKDEPPGGETVAVLSYGLWQSRFTGDAQILNHTISLGGTPYTIIGVMPPQFVAPTRADLWIPYRPRPVNDGRNISVFGLLRRGVTREQATREVAQLMQNYMRDFPEEYREFAPGESCAATAFGTENRLGSNPLWILSGAVGLMLLIACANLANLLLARATTRVREVAIRTTLGAGRGRLVRQLLAESVLITLFGAVIGLVLAESAIPALVAISPISLPEWSPVRVDGTVLGFTALAAISTGILFGFFPAMAVTRVDLSETIKESGARAGNRGRLGRLRQVTVAAEIALSLVLVIGAGLLIRTFANLVHTNPGVDPTNVIAGRMNFTGDRYGTTDKAVQMIHRGLERLQQVPGVESVAVVNNLPMERGLNVVAWLPGMPHPDEPRLTDWRGITSDYFHLMRIPLMAGRLFTGADGEQSEGVAIINQRFVRRYFGKENPIGKQINIMEHTPAPDRPRIIVGVVGDVKSNDFRRAAEPTVFVPIEQAPAPYVRMVGSFAWVVRGRESTSGLAGVMQRELKAVDPLTPFSGFSTLEDIRTRATRNDRMLMILLAGLAALSLILAAAGIYGVMSYTVARRTHEIGVRIALGATVSRVVLSVLKDGAWLALEGIVIGVGGAVLLTRFLQGLVFGVKPTDPATFIAAALFLVLVAVAACLVPALRISRLDPARALRVE